MSDLNTIRGNGRKGTVTSLAAHQVLCLLKTYDTRSVRPQHPSAVPRRLKGEWLYVNLPSADARLRIFGDGRKGTVTTTSAADAKAPPPQFTAGCRKRKSVASHARSSVLLAPRFVAARARHQRARDLSAFRPLRLLAVPIRLGGFLLFEGPHRAVLRQSALMELLDPFGESSSRPQHLRLFALHEVVPGRDVLEGRHGETFGARKGHEGEPVLRCGVETLAASPP